MIGLSAWFTFSILMTAIAYTPGPMTMFSMSSSVRNGFSRTLPAIAGGSFAYYTQMVVVYLGLGVVVQQSIPGRSAQAVLKGNTLGKSPCCQAYGKQERQNGTINGFSLHHMPSFLVFCFTEFSVLYAAGR